MVALMSRKSLTPKRKREIAAFNGWRTREGEQVAIENGELALSTANYDGLLIGWDAQALHAGVRFSGGNSNYCSAPAIAARANMIASDSWVITDGGQACPPDNIFADGFESGE